MISLRRVIEALGRIAIIPSKNLSTQYKLLGKDLEIQKDRRMKTLYDQPRIKWGDLTLTLAPALSREMEEKLIGMETCSSGHVDM